MRSGAATESTEGAGCPTHVYRAAEIRNRAFTRSGSTELTWSTFRLLPDIYYVLSARKFRDSRY